MKESNGTVRISLDYDINFRDRRFVVNPIDENPELFPKSYLSTMESAESRAREYTSRARKMGREVEIIRTESYLSNI